MNPPLREQRGISNCVDLYGDYVLVIFQFFSTVRMFSKALSFGTMDGITAIPRPSTKTRFLVIYKRLLTFFPRVHYKWPMLNYRLA